MLDEELKIDRAKGEIVLHGDIVSVKAAGRDVYVRWEGKTKQFVNTGLKMPYGLTKFEKEHFLLQKRHLLLERYYAERLDQLLDDGSGGSVSDHTEDETASDDAQKNYVEVKK